MGILSRGVSGIAGRTLIVNFPGSPKSIEQLFGVIAPVLGHVGGDATPEPGRPCRPGGLSSAGSSGTSASGRRCARPPVSVPSGATLAVLGRNGAGKSTLLRILATLLRPHGGRPPCSASRCRGGPSQSGLGSATRARPASVSGPERPGEPGLSRPAARGRSRAGSRAAGGGGHAGARRRTGPVAVGGMVQRLAVCRAVLHGPELLLLDEPRANLDPAAAGSSSADRTVSGSHASADQPRPARGAGRGRSRAGAPGWTRRAGRFNRRHRRGASRGALPVTTVRDDPAAGAPVQGGYTKPLRPLGILRTARIVLAKDLLLELRSLETAAGDGRCSPSPRSSSSTSRLDRTTVVGPAGGWDSDRHAAVRLDAGHQPPVRGRARAGGL